MSELDPTPDPRLAAALERWRVPPARPAFRAELRERFLAAPLSPAREGGASRVAPVAPASPAARGPRPARASWSRSRAASLAGLAAVVLAVLGIRWLLPPAAERESEPDAPLAGVTAGGWTIWGGAGAVAESGRELADPAALARALAAGERVTTGAAPLRAAYGDELFLELGPDSAAALQGAPELAAGVPSGSARLVAASGAVLVATGTGFRGLDVEAPAVRLRVTGTVFAVDCLDTHTCVCCLEGELALFETEEDGALGRLPGGRTWLVDCAEPRGEAMDMPAPHRAVLESFVERADRLWPHRHR